MRLECLCLFVCLADALIQVAQLVVHLTHTHIYTAGYELIGEKLAVKHVHVNSEQRLLYLFLAAFPPCPDALLHISSSSLSVLWSILSIPSFSVSHLHAHHMLPKLSPRVLPSLCFPPARSLAPPPTPTDLKSVV